MPIYEYHCTSCGKNMEIVQKISEAPKKKCPECGGKLEKLMSATSFALKGTGWYKTDYAPKPPGGKPAPASPSKPTGGAEVASKHSS